MKTFGLFLAGVLAAALVGCGGSTIAPQADPSYVRAIHLASDVTNVNVLFGGSTFVGNLSPGVSAPPNGQSFRVVDRGETTVEIRPSGTATNALETTADLSGNDLVSLIVAGSATATAGSTDALRLVRIADAKGDLDRTKANLRIFHGAIGVGNVDVYLTPGDAATITGTPVLSNVPRYAVSDLQEVAPGTYTVFVAPTGTTTAAIRQVVDLQAGYFVVAAETIGGASLSVYGTTTLP